MVTAPTRVSVVSVAVEEVASARVAFAILNVEPKVAAPATVSEPPSRNAALAKVAVL